MKSIISVILSMLVALCVGIAIALAPKATIPNRAERRWDSTHRATGRVELPRVATMILIAPFILSMIVLGGGLPIMVGSIKHDHEAAIKAIKVKMAENTKSITDSEKKLETAILAVSEKTALKRRLAGLHGQATKLRKALAAEKAALQAEKDGNAVLAAFERIEAQRAHQVEAQRERDIKRAQKIWERQQHEAEQTILQNVFDQLPISYEEEAALEEMKKARSYEHKVSSVYNAIKSEAKNEGLSAVDTDALRELAEIIINDPDMSRSGIVEEVASSNDIANKFYAILARVIPNKKAQEYYSMLSYTSNEYLPIKLAAAINSEDYSTRISALEDLVGYLNTPGALAARRPTKVDTQGWSLGAKRIGISPRTFTGK